MRAQSGSACGNAGATPAQTAKSSPVSRPTPAQACAVVAPVVFHEVGAGVESPDGAPGPMESTGRRDLCAACRAAVPDPQPLRSGAALLRRRLRLQRARAASLRSGTRYQASFPGRLAHAQRQRRYRARRQEVTHQGSPPPAPPVEVRTAPTGARFRARVRHPSASGQCHLCSTAHRPRSCVRNPVRALRPERLLDPPRPCAPPHRVRRPAAGAHPRRRGRDRHPRARLRPPPARSNLPRTSRRSLHTERAASAHRATDRLTAAVPTCQALARPGRRAR